MYEVERLGRRITVERPLVLIGWEGRASASAWDNADLMVREWQGILALHVGNYASRETRLAFSPVRANDGAAASAGEKPLPRLEAAGLRVLSAVDALGGEADVAVEEMDGQLCVTIRHRGAVDLMIGCPSADGGETAPS